MQIIISPAKKMRDELDSLAPRSQPVFGQEAGQLAGWLKSLSYEELKERLSCSEAIARQNYERYQKMDLTKNLSPAILSYEGIQYQYMAPGVFTYQEFDYLQQHLAILSGLYGLLRPFDGVRPYRLEMGTKLKAPFGENLYDFWGDRLARELTKEDRVVVNLASWEYGRAVVRHLGEDAQCITPVFGQLIGGKVVEKGVYVKMARGEMVRFLAERQGEKPQVMQKFDALGYRYDPTRSDEKTYVFLKP